MTKYRALVGMECGSWRCEAGKILKSPPKELDIKGMIKSGELEEVK